MKNIIFIAPPAAGKGTQAALLNEKYGYVPVSTGDLLRNAVAAHDERSAHIEGIMNSGGLVDDDIIFELLEERITMEDAKEGYILDGFPRTIDQAKRYEELANKLGHELGYVLYIKIDKELAMKRACGRVTCSDCGAIFNKYFDSFENANHCNKCGSELTSRSDDNEETFNARFDTYMSKTSSLIEYYKDKGLLHEIMAMEERLDTFAQIEKVINN